MNAKHVALLSLLIAAASLIAMSTREPAFAQGQPAAAPAGGIKIGTASAQRIFFGMKEMRDVEAKFKQDLTNLETEGRSREQKVVDQRNNLGLLKPDSPQYEEEQRKYMQAASDHKAWLELNRAVLQRSEKIQLKMLFDKITGTIGEIAKERGVDLVLSDQAAFNIDRMSTQDLQQAMAQREILYKNASLDITQDVIKKLDEQYNAQKK